MSQRINEDEKEEYIVNEDRKEEYIAMLTVFLDIGSYCLEMRVV